MFNIVQLILNEQKISATRKNILEKNNFISICFSTIYILNLPKILIISSNRKHYCKRLAKELAMITDSIPTLHYKDLLELSILLLLDAGELSSTGLIEDLTRRELLKTEGLVFPILAKLKSDGHVAGRQAEENGPTTRKYYRITDTGKQELDRLEAQWEKLAAQMNDLIQRKSEL